jgi:hypothetical protein
MLRSPSQERSFADEVAEATGLAPMFSKGVIERCCKRVGIAHDGMQRGDLEKLLPHLESALLVYKSGREVMAALDRLKRLATGDKGRLQSWIRPRQVSHPASDQPFLRRRVATER